LYFGDDEFGVVLYFVLVFDELADDHADVEEGDAWEAVVGAVGELFDFAVGVVEEVEEFCDDVLDEEGHVLEGEFDVEFGESAQDLEGLDGNDCLF
jgi:hypothetical protein